MEEQTTQGIDLSVFLHNFRRTLQHFFWVPIVLGLLLGGVSWLRAARSYAPVYQSSAVFSVSAGFSSSTDILSHSTYLDSNAAAQLSATFPYVLQSDRMQLLLQQELGDQRAPVSLSASSVADAALFTLTAAGQRIVPCGKGAVSAHACSSGAFSACSLSRPNTISYPPVPYCRLRLTRLIVALEAPVFSRMSL